MKQFSACVLITATFLNVPLAYAQMPVTGAARAASAALTQAQGRLAAYRAQQRVVRADLADGSTVTGHIGDIQDPAFYIVPVGSRDGGWRIRYSELTAVTDDTTGERLMTFASPLPTGPERHFRPQYIGLIVAGAAIAIFVMRVPLWFPRTDVVTVVPLPEGSPTIGARWTTPNDVRGSRDPSKTSNAAREPVSSRTSHSK